MAAQKKVAEQIAEMEAQKTAADAEWRVADEAFARIAREKQTHIMLLNELRIKIEKTVCSFCFFSLYLHVFAGWRSAASAHTQEHAV